MNNKEMSQRLKERQKEITDLTENKAKITEFLQYLTMHFKSLNSELESLSDSIKRNKEIITEIEDDISNNRG